MRWLVANWVLIVAPGAMAWMQIGHGVVLDGDQADPSQHSSPLVVPEDRISRMSPIGQIDPHTTDR